MMSDLLGKLRGLLGRKPAPASKRPAPPEPAVDPQKKLIQTLKEAIRRIHGCEAAHVQTLPVAVDSGGKIIWQGKVELFSLKNHPKATRCYAWMHPPGHPVVSKIVLEIPPIDSPRKAVYTALLKDHGADDGLSTSSQFLEAVKSVIRREPRK